MRLTPSSRLLAQITMFSAVAYLLSGCSSPTKTYEGAERPETETALLYGSSGASSPIFGAFASSSETKVIAIDGKPVEGHSRYALLPGEHQIKLAFTSYPSYPTPVPENGMTSIVARAGHEYQIYGSRSSKTAPVQFMIYDYGEQCIVEGVGWSGKRCPN